MIESILGMALIVCVVLVLIVVISILLILAYEGYKSISNKSKYSGNKLININVSGKQLSALCIWEECHIDHIFKCIHEMIDNPDRLYCPKSENSKIKHEKSSIIIFGIVTNQQLPQIGEQIRKQLFDIYADKNHKGGTVNVV